MMKQQGSLRRTLSAATSWWTGPLSGFGSLVVLGLLAVQTLVAAASEENHIPAEARNYWAFRRPERPVVPTIKNQEWARHPVDAFLMQAFEKKGLTPAPPAHRTALVRRAYFDLIGLPPTPEEIAAFVNDPSVDAWERLIGRLLASPHYGERWGRHWLDVARYADSNGFEHDLDRPTAWRYRDYVIQSLNRDTPYNLFIAEQLAGDELDHVSFETQTATGFLRAGPRVGFREKDNPQYRFDYLDDMIATTCQGILALTVQCARCHDHKFDPIPQKDYYRLQSIFFPHVDVDFYQAPATQIETFLRQREELEAKMNVLRQQVSEIEAPYREKVFLTEILNQFPEEAQLAVKTPESQRTSGQKLLANQLIRAVGVDSAAVDRVLGAEDRAKKEAVKIQIKELERLWLKTPVSATGITDGDYRFAPDGYGDEPAPGKGGQRDPNLKGSYLHRGNDPYVPPPSYFLDRGEIESRGPQIEPGFISVITNGNPPTAIAPAQGHTSGRRRALAEWIGSPDNPLTARVLVNRLWHHHFGRGLVPTLNNFGLMGDRPTHPELLDWLACELIARGWSIKQMHRLIMTSRAYQMSSQFENEANQNIDPENHLLWKLRIQRTEAEVIRDSILAVSGKLNGTLGGLPVFPQVDSSVLATMKHGRWDKQEDGPQVWRRSVYVYRKRGMPFPMFDVFDLPDQNVSCNRRYTSTVPTQALVLLNDEFVLRQARFFAERIAAEAGPDLAAQVARGYLIALGREPEGDERHLNLDFLARQRQFHQGDSLAALTDLAHVLLNLNEFIYIR